MQKVGLAGAVSNFTQRSAMTAFEAVRVSDGVAVKMCVEIFMTQE